MERNRHVLHFAFMIPHIFRACFISFAEEDIYYAHIDMAALFLHFKITTAETSGRFASDISPPPLFLALSQTCYRDNITLMLYLFLDSQSSFTSVRLYITHCQFLYWCSGSTLPYYFSTECFHSPHFLHIIYFGLILAWWLFLFSGGLIFIMLSFPPRTLRFTLSRAATTLYYSPHYFAWIVTLYIDT